MTENTNMTEPIPSDDNPRVEPAPTSKGERSATGGDTPPGWPPAGTHQRAVMPAPERKGTEPADKGIFPFEDFPELDERSKREAELMSQLNPDLSPQETAGILRELNASSESAEPLLKGIGYSPEDIAEIIKLSKLSELTDEEKENPPEIDMEEKEKAIEEESAKTEEIKGKQLRGEKLTEGDYLHLEKSRTRLGELLFNDEGGLLRPEQRFRRLVIQPAVIGLIAAFITYMILLNSVTKKANVRAGH